VLTGKKTRTLPKAAERYKWPKGHSGNPSGRPKKKPLTDALEALMSEPYPVDTLPVQLRQRLGLKDSRKYTFAEITARCLILGVQTGKGGIATCFKEMAERLEGKVTLPVEVTSPRDGLDELNEDELKTFIETGEMPARQIGQG
jgi:hypothetical protein